MKTPVAALALTTVFVATGLRAHHGSVNNGVLYLTDNLIEIEGEMTEVFWHNPHTRGRMTVVNDSGEESVWEVELGPGPRTMEARGLAPDDFLGQVRVAGFVSRKGTNVIGPLHVLLPDGREYAQGDRALRWAGERIVDRPEAIDPARIEEARRTANGIFRMWGRKEGEEPEVDISRDWLSEHGREIHAAYDPVADNRELSECRQGMPDAMWDPVPMEIADHGDYIAMEVSEYNTMRTIYMDTATSPEPVPSPTGYSTGRWVGDTLVVTTTHVDWPHYSEFGLPQSDQASHLERFTVFDDGNRLHHLITVIDPVMLSRPYTLERTRTWMPGYEILPYNCVVEWEDSAD